MPSDGPPGRPPEGGPAGPWSDRPTGPPAEGGWGTPAGAWPPPGRADEHEPEVDGVARRTSPLTVATGLASLAGAGLLLGLQLALPRPDGGDSPPVLLLVIGLVLAVRGLSDTLGWLLRTYSVTPDRLVIDEGVLTRHHRVVPFERVQQVDVSQDLLGQALGLAAVRIDSAGEGASTVHLKLLEKRRAEGLRSFVLTRRAALQAARHDAGAGTATSPAGAPAPPPPEQDLLALDAGRLAVSVLAGPLAVALGAVGLVGVLTGIALVLRGGEVAGGTTLLALTVVGVPGIALMAVSGAVLTLWDFTVSSVGDDLRLRHGLLQVRSLTLPRRRVQHVTVVDGPLQRAVGFVSVSLHSAAPPSGAGANETRASSRFDIPYVRRQDLPAVLHSLLGGDWVAPALHPRDAAARRRAVLRRTVVGALAGAPALLAGPAGLLVVVAGGAAGWAWGLGAHHRAGWAETPTLVVLAHGLLVHHVELVPVNRVQSARSTASPFQRRLGLATAHLDLAGGGAPHLYDMPAEPVGRLVDQVPRRGATTAASR